MRKLLTVIVPSYNMEAYLRTCLQSAIVEDKHFQSRTEIIVINDGSTDSTSQIAHEFEKKYPDVIRVVDKNNGHYGSCVNTGIAEAQGLYIRVLDADDTHDTIQFEKYLNFIEETEDNPVDFILSDYVRIYADKPNREIVHYDFQNDELLTPFQLAKNKCDILTPAIAYRTAFLRDLKYRQTEGIPYSDTDWFFYPMAVAKRGVYSAAKIYLYLLGREGQSNDPNVWGRGYDSMKKILIGMLEFYHNHHDDGSACVNYMEMIIERVERLTMSFYATRLPLRRVCQEIVYFSQLHARIPLLRGVCAAYTYFNGTPIAFEYMAWCLRHPWGAYLVFPVSRLARVVRSLVRRK